MVLSSAIVCDNDRRIADDRISVFPYDRRRSQNFLRSASRDPRLSAIIWKPALSGICKCSQNCIGLEANAIGGFWNVRSSARTIAPLILFYEKKLQWRAINCQADYELTDYKLTRNLAAHSQSQSSNFLNYTILNATKPAKYNGFIIGLWTTCANIDKERKRILKHGTAAKTPTERQS